MRDISTKERQLIADFFSNIGVAWFAGGVVGIFIKENKNLFDIFVSVTWGIILSLIFLFIAVKYIKK